MHASHVPLWCKKRKQQRKRKTSSESGDRLVGTKKKSKSRETYLAIGKGRSTLVEAWSYVRPTPNSAATKIRCTNIALKVQWHLSILLFMIARIHCSLHVPFYLLLQRGVCWRHCAKASAKLCSHKGCTKNSINGGVCWTHGAKAGGQTFQLWGLHEGYCEGRSVRMGGERFSCVDNLQRWCTRFG